MNYLKNSVLLIGNLGQDPKEKTVQNGNKFVRFTIATNEYYKNKEGHWITNTEWHNCVVWGKMVERVQHQLKKGKHIALKGRLTYRKYEDKNGVNQTFSEVNVNEFIVLNRESTKG